MLKKHLMLYAVCVSKDDYAFDVYIYREKDVVGGWAIALGRMKDKRNLV